MRITTRLTAGVLATLSALHFAWGLGSSVPFRTREELADAVVGTTAVPPAPACVAVAGALAAGAALVANAIPVASGLRRSALGVMACVFGLRGGLGLMGRTDMVSRGSHSERFLRLDRRVYAPLCVALALGCGAASRYAATTRRLP